MHKNAHIFACMVKEKAKIPTRFTLNLTEDVAKMLIDLCGYEGRKKNPMIAVLITRAHAKYKKK